MRVASSRMDLVRAATGELPVGIDETEINYLTSLFTRTSLPYQDPGDIPAWIRTNGKFVMVVTPGFTTDDHGNALSLGYPFGSVPRLLLVWLCTQIVRRPDAERIILGTSLADFLRELGMPSTGGVNGTIGRLRKQARRLFEANISAKMEGDANRDFGGKLSIATMWNLHWTDGTRELDGQQPLFHEDAHGRRLFGYIDVDPTFRREVLKSPVPMSVMAISMLRRSPMAMDLYFFITYRVFRLENPITITWEQLRLQFGSAYSPAQEWKFRKDMEKHLASVKIAYPQANAEITPAGLLLKPSLTSVPLKGTRTLRGLMGR
jgi:Plasmid encoded RepA protein